MINSMTNYPIINFGTYRLTEKDINLSLETALSVGYRSIDTACLYKNEKFIGDYLGKNAISRDSIWITSKLSPRVIPKSEDEIIKSITTTLTELNTDYLDLYLIHAPIDEHIVKCWSILEQFKQKGIFRNIGVSNFNVSQLQKITDFSTTPIFTNQIELSPFLTRTNLVSYMKEHNIPISAHSSLTKGEKLSNPVLCDIAKKYDKSPAQIMLIWGLQNGYNVIPRSSNPLHIKENIELDFSISDGDMKTLNDLNCEYYTHPQYRS
jgi:diketogulonate reductase-like aldo/keto reductase